MKIVPFLLLLPIDSSTCVSWTCVTVMSADAGSHLCSLSVSLQRCFTLMDRGFTFKLISNYINMITATDSKVQAMISKDTSVTADATRRTFAEQ